MFIRKHPSDVFVSFHLICVQIFVLFFFLQFALRKKSMFFLCFLCNERAELNLEWMNRKKMHIGEKKNFNQIYYHVHRSLWKLHENIYDL